MAAGVPVVSTSVGAEGLAVADGRDISLADDPATFAARCLELLDRPQRNRAIANAALQLVQDRFSWEQVGRHFESILESSCNAYA